MRVLEPSRYRRFLGAISGPRALNWRVGLWGLGATSVLNLVSDPYVNFRDSFAMAWVPFLASIPPLILMLIVNEIASRQSRFRLVTVLGTYAVVATVRPVFISLFVDAINPTEMNNPLFRPYGTVVTFGILIVVSFSINVVGAFQQAISQAEATRERLRGALELAQCELGRPAQRLDSDVRLMIDDVISDIRRNLSNPRDSAELQRLADVITLDSTNRIRTLSREYAQRWSRVDLEREDSTTLWHTRDLLRAAASRNVYAPLLVSALTAGTMMYGILPRSTNAPIAMALIGVWFAVTAALLFVARWAHRLIWPMRDRHAAVQGIFFYLSTFLAAEGASFVTGIVGPGFNVPAFTQFLVAPIFALAIAACVGLGSGLSDSTAEILESAEKTNADIARVLARVNAQRMRTQGAVSHFLHGRVQGQLIAASLLVSTRLAAGESVEAVRTQIEQLLDDITLADLDSIDPPSVFEGLESVTRPWSSILDVTIDISDDACTALDADPLGRFIFFDVINEAVNNAVKHGRASRVIISASREVPTEVQLVVTNDGEPWPENGTSGLGTLSLTTITTSMQVEKTTSGSALRVSLPLAPVASRDY